MPPLPPSKLSRVRDALARGDHVQALRIAAAFPELGRWKGRITRGWAAHLQPEFYRELGHDPLALFWDAILAVCERYGIPAPQPRDAPAPPE